MSFEERVLKEVGFEPTREYKDRQDYLAAILVASEKISDHDFEYNVSEDVADWLNEGYKARRTKKPIPDFPDTEEAEPVDASQDEGEVYVEEFVSKAELELTETVENTPYPEPKAAKKPRKPRAKLTGKFNRFGVAEGSKRDMAIKFFEKGSTMKAVKEATGEAHYNVLKELAMKGHKVTSVDGVITLTHKDDLGA